MNSPTSAPTPDATRAPDGRRRRWLDVALTCAAVLGIVCTALTLVGLVSGVRPVIFETGSMAPTASAGSLGFSRTVPAASVHRGDIVTVTGADGTRLTHRVVSVGDFTGDSATLILKGDANKVPDPKPYVVTTVDRVSSTVPILGYIVSWLKNPFTLALQALALAALLTIAFAPRQGWRNSPTAHRLVAGTAAVSAVAVVVGGTAAPGEAQAAPGESATATGMVTTGRPDNPTSLTCADSGFLIGGKATLSWPNAEPAGSRGRYSYVLTTGSTVVTTIPPTQADTITYVFQTGLLMSIINVLVGAGGVVTLHQRVGEFESESGLSQTISISVIPLGFRCKTAGTVPGQVPRQSRLTPTSSTELSSPDTSATTPTPSPTQSLSPSSDPPLPAPTTSSTQPLPPGGTTTASGDFAFYRDGSEVTIRSATTTEVVYRDNVALTATVRWIPGSEELEIVEADGAVTVVTQQSGRWTASVTSAAPQATAETTPPASTTPEAGTPPESAGPTP